MANSETSNPTPTIPIAALSTGPTLFQVEGHPSSMLGLSPAIAGSAIRDAAIAAHAAAPLRLPPIVQRTLARAASGHHDRKSPQDEIEIVADAPVIDVPHVQVHPFLERDLVPSGNLPDTSQSGANRKPAPLPPLVLRDFLRDGRAGADDAHVAAEHVDELRQLVDAVLAHKPAERRDPWIVLDLEHR